MNNDYHQSVLFKEALEALNIVPGEVYLDTTLGGGGHTDGIIQAGGRALALDVDTDAINYASKRFDASEKNGVWLTPSGNLKIYKKNFRDLDEISENGLAGILFDLGVSSFMLDTPERGFSFSKQGSLDMRMDSSLGVTARDLINALNEGELYELFTKFGEERHARRLARNIVQNRLTTPLETTRDLAQFIEKTVGYKKGEINPSTRVFMALRIAVNDELNVLREALPKAVSKLKKGGRLVVISFHSLEDRIVKDFFRENESLKILTKKPLTASVEELRVNPRSRSAKMRVAEKII